MSENIDLLTLRLKSEEAERFTKILKKSQKVSAFKIRKSDVIRILIGLDKPNQVVTKEDVEYFRGEKI